MRNISRIGILILVFAMCISCAKNEERATEANKPDIKAVSPETNTGKKEIPVQKHATEEQPEKKTENKPEIKVTFIELGSVKCVPCRMMQPIMEEIENEYKGQVKVLFYDVWTQEGKPYARKFGIRVIPTQVFLDKDGNEYFRHEGYFPKDELIKVLEIQALNKQEP